MNRTGVPGSVASGCDVARRWLSSSPPSSHGWLTEWQGARLETGGRVFAARGRSIRPPSAYGERTCRGRRPRFEGGWPLGRCGAGPPLSSMECVPPVRQRALKTRSVPRRARGSTPPHSAGRDPAGRRGLPDTQVLRGSIPRWPTTRRRSSAGQSVRLITGWSLVRIQSSLRGPVARKFKLHPPHSVYAAQKAASSVNGRDCRAANRRRVGVMVISPGPQPGDCRFKSGTRHRQSRKHQPRWRSGASLCAPPRPHRLWVRIAALQAAGRSSSLRGVAARRCACNSTIRAINLAWPNGRAADCYSGGGGSSPPARA